MVAQLTPLAHGNCRFTTIYYNDNEISSNLESEQAPIRALLFSVVVAGTVHFTSMKIAHAPNVQVQSFTRILTFFL